MSWKNQLREDSLPWLLESEDPGVQYVALRDLLDLSPDDHTGSSPSSQGKSPYKWDRYLV